MFKIKAFMLSAVMAVSAFVGQAQSKSDALDSEGYPVFSLRGSNIGAQGQWNANVEGYVFTRQGNTYTLHCNSLEGEFKIAGDNWEYNYGTSLDVVEITSSCTLYGIKNGDNWKAPSKLEDVNITFDFDKNDSYHANISMTVGNVEISVPGLSGTLPVLYINVRNEDGSYNNEITSYDLDHKNYFAGEYWLDVNGCQWLEDLGAANVGSSEAPLPLQIKARGNWTRKGFSKKPFKLKLEKKQSLLGLSKSKHFAIIAHPDDQFGYMRNFTGFNLGKRIGLPWTPWQQPVEVVINGNYRGLYFLTESIRIASDRVNVEELVDNETNASLCSGGYLVELDNYDEDDSAQIRMEEKSCVEGQNLDVLRVTFDTPEEYSPVMRKFITEQFTNINDLVGRNSNDLWRYIDLDDAVRYYLVEEIISHTESYHGSTYLFRDRGENQKWHFSPLWDCGNAFSGYDDQYFYDCDPFGNTWIPSFRANAKFNDKLKETWLWFMANEYDGIVADLEEYANHIKAAAKADHARWKNEPHPDGGQDVADNSDMDSKLNIVKQKLAAKINWLKNQPDFGDYTISNTAEPVRDNTPAMPLPSYVAMSVTEGIVVDDSAESVYFNLQGIPVQNPEPGQTYIKVCGGKGEKVVK